RDATVTGVQTCALPILSRLVITRGLGVIYLVAFLVALNQFRPLLGGRGLLPAPRFLSRVTFRQAPSLFHLRYSDQLLTASAGLRSEERRVGNERGSRRR